MRHLLPFIFIFVPFLEFFNSQSCLLEQIRCKEENNIIDCSSIEQELVDFPCANETINRNISKIFIKNHKIKSIPSRIFSGLRTNYIDFSSNQIEIIADDAFEGISNVLFSMRLSDNRIQVIRKRHFEKFIRLSQLFLNKNQIYLIEEGTFIALISLDFLDLNYNNLSSFQDSHFKDLFNLKTLEIKGNNMIVNENKEFFRMEWLSFLVISENRIESVSEIKFNGSRMFKVLDISRNQIKSVRKEDFKAILYISSLDLSFNQISLIENSSFVDLKLKFLRLTGNLIRSIDNLLINHLPLLTFEIGFNQIQTINLD